MIYYNFNVILFRHLLINYFLQIIVIPYGKVTQYTRSRRANPSRLSSWDAPSSSLDIVMDDSSPPSSVTSSNYTTHSSQPTDRQSKEENDMPGNSWVSSTTKGAIIPIHHIKSEPPILQSSSLGPNEGQDTYRSSAEFINDPMFDDEESLEELDEDEIQGIEQQRKCNQIENMGINVKPRRIFLNKSSKQTTALPLNRLVTLGGKVVSCMKTEAASSSNKSSPKPTINGIELPHGVSSKAILKFQNPLASTSIGLDGTLMVHQHYPGMNGTIWESSTTPSSVSAKSNVKGAISKRLENKSIICHSKGTTPSTSKWLSPNNSNLKINSSMTLVTSSQSKEPKEHNIAFNESPKRYEIRPASSSGNHSISDSQNQGSKFCTPLLAKKLTDCTGRIFIHNYIFCT